MPTLEQSQWTPEIGKKLESLKPNDPVSARPVSGFGPGGEPSFPTYPRFQVTSLPLSVVYQPDALRSFYRGGVPQSRIIPVK
jgi:hypothetical protein